MNLKCLKNKRLKRNKDLYFSSISCFLNILNSWTEEGMFLQQRVGSTLMLVVSNVAWCYDQRVNN